MHEEVDQVIEQLFRRESARLTATLTRVFGVARLDLVEDVVQEGLLEALRHWRFTGLPENPAAWLTQVARRRALDALRREATHRRLEPDLAAIAQQKHWPVAAEDVSWDRARLATEGGGDGLSVSLPDDQLRLIFTCCHPRLGDELKIALTLKLACGFGVPEIARALLISPEAAAQRIVRAKRSLRENGVALEPPDRIGVAERLDNVLGVIYLMYNEGYTATTGDALVRRDLLQESARLAKLMLDDPRTASPKVHALLSIMLFQTARLETRTDRDGGVVLLDRQDRSLWDARLIALGFQHLVRSGAGDGLSAFHLEAAIAAVHARAATFESTDWREIVELYDLLVKVRFDPVARVNRAVAVSMLDGPEAGLDAVEEIVASGRLGSYFPLAAARGEMLARAGRSEEAAESFRYAMRLTSSRPERAMIQSKLDAVLRGECCEDSGGC